ncbi:MAG: transposase [Methyloprofundus sp.]|nr:transposase [Methyloprofundus sp.]
MVNYRRVYIKGGTYFFTLTLKNRRSDYLVQYINELRESFAYVKQQASFDIVAIVILPEHLHCILTLPEGDDAYPIRWQKIKSRFTLSLKRLGVELKKNKRGEYNLWQARYWEHIIKDEEDLHRHIDYIHFNPVKHGLVESVAQWPFSSFHRYVEEGSIEHNWGESPVETLCNYGELY